jgi:hypothetical protein
MMNFGARHDAMVFIRIHIRSIPKMHESSNADSTTVVVITITRWSMNRGVPTGATTKQVRVQR